MKPVKVPDVPGPKGVCWKQDVRGGVIYNFARCSLKKGHKGPHSWLQGEK